MKRKIIRRYNPPFKQIVIALLEGGHLKSIEEARRAFGISGKETIQKWLKAYNKEYLLPIIKVRKLEEELGRIKAEDPDLYEKIIAEKKLESKNNNS